MVAEDIPYTIVSDQLNLRVGPYARAAIIVKLNKGALVTPLGEKAAKWWRVRATDGGVTSTGWLNSTFLQQPQPQTPPSVPHVPQPIIPSANSKPIVPPTPTIPPPVASPPPAPQAGPALSAPQPSAPKPAYRFRNSPLSSSLSSFKCRDSYIGEGIDRCTVEVDITYDGDRDVSGDFQVHCAADVEFLEREAYFPNKRSGDEYGSIYVSYGYGSTMLSIDVKPSFAINPIVRALLKDVTCSYNR